MRLSVMVLCCLSVPVLSSAQDRDLYESSCRGGDPSACTVRGLMFEMGAGEDANAERALDYYRLACAREHPAGCTSIGLMYQFGRGVGRDLEIAAGQYRLACESGGALGCDLQAALQAEGPITAARPFFTGGWAADADDGSRLEGVLVDVPRLGLQAISDADGLVDLGRVPEGTYAIRAEAEGYEPVAGVLNVPGFAELVLLLTEADWVADRRLGLVGGIVLDRRQDPVQGVTIELVDRDERPVASGYEGRFTFETVEPGIARVRVTAPGHDPVEMLVIVQSGRAAVIEVTVSRDSVELARPEF